MNETRFPPPPETIAVITRLVLEALRERSAPSGAAAQVSGSAQAGGPARAGGAAQKRGGDQPAGDAAWIGDRVVSLGTLERLADGTRELRLETRSVLTPAAADWLRHRGVQVVRASGGGAAIQGAKVAEGDLPVARWVADADRPEHAAAYVRQLASRGVAAAAVPWPLPGAWPLPGEGTTGDGMGVVIADLPAVHVDRLARLESLSAAAAGSWDEVGRIAAAMEPAVWVLDAGRLSFSARVAVAERCFRLTGAGRRSAHTHAQDLR